MSIDLVKKLPGQYYDEETGLHYNIFRYYDPQLGRYITSDPIGLNGGMNTYSYVSNNPIVLIDPLGLAIWSVTSIFEVSGAVGVGASFFNIELESACYQGQKYKVKVLAVGTAAGAQIRCQFCFTAPTKVQVNEATFDDHSGSDRPDPGAFGGPFLAVSAEAQLLGFGGGVGDILLGRATNVGSNIFNIGFGTFGTFGIGVIGAIGTSTIVGTEVEECNDCD